MTRRAFPSTPVADEMVQFLLTFYSAAKLLLLLLVDLQSHLLNVEMSFLALFFTKIRGLTIKQSEPLKT